jgi:type III restriction enzyme
MKILLKDFQERAVDELVAALHRASGEVKESPRSYQAAWLTAPTGSGKTLIATAALERLLEGDQTYPPIPDATFLWLSDQPELNEQTRRKILSSSSALGPADLVVLGSAFDEEVLPQGRVHFLNIQKLSKEAALVKPGDDRTFTIWQTIANTVGRRGSAFFLIIDEAHRGTAERPAAREEAATIVQKFIKGSDADGLPPVPLIAGISATPERFQRVIGGAGRVQRPVEVPPENVRASGLLKDFIDLHHPIRAQASDITMLGQAAKAWRDVWDRWEKYCARTGDQVVRPILVVQVEDGTAKQLTKTDLKQCVEAITRAVGQKADALLPARAFAHAFQEMKPAKVGTLEIRHINPSEIVDDPDVRVVLFKTSLNTGWDCPRAETMMSFRTALDATSIAQLVGRMVRTPLARRIEADESLNSVSLYLPHYDAANLDKVVAKLTGADPDTAVPVEVRRGEDVIDLDRAKGSALLFDALSELPSYVVPKLRRTNEVKRLTKLAFLLANDAINEAAPDEAADGLLTLMTAEYDKRRETETFKKWLESAKSVEIAGRRVRLGVAEEGSLEERTAVRAQEDLDDQFEEAGRKLGEGLHKRWWRRRVDVDESAREVAKAEVIALAAEPAVLAALEEAARAKTQGWLRNYAKEIKGLTEAARQGYVEIRALASRSEQVDREPYPDRIQVTKADKRWLRHVYVDEAGMYPSKFNKWETKVIEQQLAKKREVVGWLRNLPRKPWSLTIPYWRGGEEHPQYPDFLILRRTGKGEVIVDLLEPHMTDLADAAAKALGLAKYADRHADRFGSIEFIVVDGDDVVSLDLTDERWRKKVLVFAEGGDPEKLKALLEEAAGS